MKNTRNSVPEPSELTPARSDVELIRDKAITFHNDLAGYLDSKYQGEGQNYFRSSFAYGRKKLEVLLDETLMGLPNGSNILDIGCGTGEQVFRYRQMGFNTTGIEPASEMRHIAQSRNGEAPILDGLATSLPFENDSFDAIFAIEVLRYLHRSDIQQAYREIGRVLRPGGKIFFTMLNRFSSDGYLIFDMLRRKSLRLLGRTPRVHNAYFTPKVIKRDLSSLGFNEIVCHGRMMGILRFPYKVNVKLGAQIAKSLEPLDDWLSRSKWTVPLASHLVVVATRKSA